MVGVWGLRWKRTSQSIFHYIIRKAHFLIKAKVSFNRNPAQEQDNFLLDILDQGKNVYWFSFPCSLLILPSLHFNHSELVAKPHSAAHYYYISAVCIHIAS